MSKPAKKSARERLVAYYRMGVGCEDPRCGSCKHFAKLLRAHERELAERVRQAADADVGFWYEREDRRQAAIPRIVAAILKRSAAPKAHGPRAAKRGGR